MEYESVIGLEVHAELATRSKMFCSCPVVERTQASPNSAVCPVCAGMPGTLPVLNQSAVEFGIRVALALGCQVLETSVFARKNYFYPDLPKGYQISQYEQPLAVNGVLPISTSKGERKIRIRRVHLEEDTGKLTHVHTETEDYSLIDLNRAGVPLLEVVTEPDMRSVEEAHAYGAELRSILRCLGVNSGDMEKGVIRFEANVSIRPVGCSELGTRVEIKNLNSFRALERSIQYEVIRQQQILDQGGSVLQETVGWDDVNEVTVSQRSKEEAHDYRYFPEPDLPPLVVSPEWVASIALSLPELPQVKIFRFQQQYGLSEYDAKELARELDVANFFEACVANGNALAPKLIANWVLSDLFSFVNQHGLAFSALGITPNEFDELLGFISRGEITQVSARAVLNEMLETGKEAQSIISERGLSQVSDAEFIADLVRKVLAENPAEVASYHAGKVTLANWFFGQVNHLAKGKANPAVVREEIDRQLK